MRIVVSWFVELDQRQLVAIRCEYKDLVLIQVEKGPIFVFGWDRANFFRAIKKLLGFVQESRKKWDIVAGEQIAEVEYETIDSEEGEAKACSVDVRHFVG
jgi:hypothetical protein